MAQASLAPDNVLECLLCRNMATDVVAFSLQEIATIDLLEDTPTPPLPWKKEVGRDKDGEASVCFTNPHTGDTAVAIGAIYEMEGLAAAMKHEGWQRIWDAPTRSVHYKSPSLGVTAASLREAIEADTAEERRVSLAAAADVDPPWGKEYCFDRKAVFYHNAEAQLTDFTFGEAARHATLSAAPDPPLPWVKDLVEAVATDVSGMAGGGVVVYRHPDTLEIQMSVEAVRKSEGIAAAAYPGDRWVVQWNAATETAEYHSVRTGLIVPCIDDVVMHNALEDTADLGIDGWEGAWDASTKAVYFYNTVTNKTVWTAEEAHIEHALQGAEDPGTAWAKEWSPATNTVVFRHRTKTTVVAADLAGVAIANALEAAHTPQPPWVKFWCGERAAVRFRNPNTGKVVDIPERLSVEYALDAMPDSADPRWQKQWVSSVGSAGAIFYCNPTVTPHHYVDSILRVCIANTLEAAPDPGLGWVRVWNPLGAKEADAFDDVPAHPPDTISAAISVADDGSVRGVHDGSGRAHAEDPAIDNEAAVTGISDKEVQEAVALGRFAEDVAERVVGFKSTLTGRVASSIAEVHQHNAVLDAPDPGAGWRVEWDDHDYAKAVYYVNAASGARANNLAEVAQENARQMVEAAPEAGAGWTKRWDAAKRVIEYYNQKHGVVATTAADASILDRMNAAPDPGLPWSKKWDHDAECVVFVNITTGDQVPDLARVAIANELAGMPDPGRGWVKEWCALFSYPQYRHTRSKAVATTLADVAAENERFALAEAPLAGKQWQPRWSAVDEAVYYFNAGTGCRAKSPAEANQVDLLSQLPEHDNGIVWEKVWVHAGQEIASRSNNQMDSGGSEAVRSVSYNIVNGVQSDEYVAALVQCSGPMYRHGVTKELLPSVEAIEEKEGLSNAPPVPAKHRPSSKSDGEGTCTIDEEPGWNLVWDRCTKSHCYQHSHTDATVAHVDDIACADAVITATDVAGWTKAWSRVRGCVTYKSAETGLKVVDAASALKVNGLVAAGFEISCASDIKHAEAVDSEEDVAGWRKSWVAAADCVVYEHVETLMTALTAAVARKKGKHHAAKVMEMALKTAPEPPQPWEKHYQPDVSMVCYVNTNTNAKVFSIDEVIAANRNAAAEANAAAEVKEAKKIAAATAKAAANAQAHATATSDTGTLGSLSTAHWDSDGMQDRKLYHVPNHPDAACSVEYGTVLKRFHATLPRSGHTVLGIERIENYFQHAQYELQIKAIYRMHRERCVYCGALYSTHEATLSSP